MKYALDVALVDVKVRDPNVHALTKGKDPQTGVPQSKQEAQQSMKAQMGKSATQDTQTKQDVPTHNFGKDPKTMLDWAFHTFFVDLPLTQQQRDEMFKAALDTLKEYGKKADPKDTDPLDPSRKPEPPPADIPPINIFDTPQDSQDTPPAPNSAPDSFDPGASIGNDPW